MGLVSLFNMQMARLGNTFNILDADGNIITSFSGNDNGTFTVSANSTFSIQVLGESSNASDTFDYNISITTTESKVTQEVDNKTK